ncbi:hypothetical protein GQ457_11G004000 [Hibiscus cannabinus]
MAYAWWQEYSRLVIYLILTSPNPTSKKTFRFIEIFCSSNGRKNAGMPIIKSSKAVEKQQSNSNPQIKYLGIKEALVK